MSRRAAADKAVRSALARQYTDLAGTEAPHGISTPLLRAIVAYETQAARKGSLPLRLRKQLQAIGQDHPVSPEAPSLKSGARLVREWNGAMHVVDVVKGGFIYREQRYRSLSAIARSITGARWSGPRFFGLTAAA